jgi:lipoate-protein ligase A
METSANWWWLRSGSGDAAFNMALDEALLELATQPVLRSYGWTQPAATFGYSQKFSALAQLTALRPLLRRPTGGGLVLHDADWTYSAVFPAGHAWFARRAEDSYRAIHELLRTAFAQLGVATELAPCCQKTLPGQCFIGHEKFDLLWRGKKIAGAAQRRTKTGLLIQGSVQPPPLGLAREAFETAFAAATGATETFSPPPALLARAATLATKKYSSLTHNARR